MKNVIVAKFQPGQQNCSFTRLETYMKAQIENSLEVGWSRKDIIVLTNFDFEFMGIKARRISLIHSSLYSSKIFAVYDLFKNGYVNEELWVHDLDAWQNSWFDCPNFKDVGICKYVRSTFNSGSVFYKPEAKDIVAVISFLLSNKKAIKEEPTFERVLSSRIYKHRVTVLNSTYNLGCCNFTQRYIKSDQPIRVCHFHPEAPKGVQMHLLGRNILKTKTVNERLERLIRRYFRVPSALGVKAKEPGEGQTHTARTSPCESEK
jgi:hypothetical protein